MPQIVLAAGQLIAVEAAQTLGPGKFSPYVFVSSVDYEQESIGLRRTVGDEDEAAVALRAGALMENEKVMWVDGHERYYVPAVGDSVIGAIRGKVGELEAYRVQILNSSNTAILPYAAFEQATRRNRPALQNGDVVYAHVVEWLQQDVECELSCVNSEGKAHGYGQLVDGQLVQIPQNYARRLYQSVQPLSTQESILTDCGRVVPMECAVALNGYVWIKSTTVTAQHWLARCIQQSAGVDDCRQMVAELQQQLGQTVQK